MIFGSRYPNLLQAVRHTQACVCLLHSTSQPIRCCNWQCAFLHTANGMPAHWCPGHLLFSQTRFPFQIHVQGRQAGGGEEGQSSDADSTSRLVREAFRDGACLIICSFPRVPFEYVTLCVYVCVFVLFTIGAPFRHLPPCSHPRL